MKLGNILDSGLVDDDEEEDDDDDEPIRQSV